MVEPWQANLFFLFLCSLRSYLLGSNLRNKTTLTMNSISGKDVWFVVRQFHQSYLGQAVYKKTTMIVQAATHGMLPPSIFVLVTGEWNKAKPRWQLIWAITGHFPKLKHGMQKCIMLCSCNSWGKAKTLGFTVNMKYVLLQQINLYKMIYNW